MAKQSLNAAETRALTGALSDDLAALRPGVRTDTDTILLIIVSLVNLVQVNLYSVETGKKEHELDTKGSTFTTDQLLCYNNLCFNE